MGGKDLLCGHACYVNHETWNISAQEEKTDLHFLLKGHNTKPFSYSLDFKRPSQSIWQLQSFKTDGLTNSLQVFYFK